MFPPGISGNPQGCHSQSLHSSSLRSPSSSLSLPSSFVYPLPRLITSALYLVHFRTSPPV